MSDMRLPVEVDPWSDGRWSRIERELFEKLAGPDATARELARGRVVQRRAVAIGGLLAAAAAVAAVFIRPSGVLRTSDRMRIVTTDSASEVTVGESSLLVAPRSLVMVSGDDEHGVDVLLDRGTVTCEVAPRKGRPPFIVDAGGVRVRVIGTRFTVARDGVATSVIVDHGVVEVSTSGKVAVLHDGDHWPAQAAPSAPAPAPSFVAPSSTAVLEAPPPSAGRGADAPTPRLRAGVVPSARPSATSEAATSAPVDGSPLVEVFPESSSTKATPNAPSSSPQADYEVAARLEKTRPDAAARIYRQLVAAGTAWTPSAMFALGRLEAERGNRAEATRALREYLVRYPRGLNADDARTLLQRMQ